MTFKIKPFSNTITVLVLAVILAFSGIFALPQQAAAEDTAPGPDISEIWVVPEVISGARQPADGGMFAWVTFDYGYSGNQLADDLSPSDFTLQMKTPGGEWTDVAGNNIAVMGGEEYYIAYFEAIVAARVPDNTDPFIKKWRLSYKPEGAESAITSEVIVQAANLEETDDVTAFSSEYCADFRVEEVPWSYEQYQQDLIPPVYVAYVFPEVITKFRDTGLVKAEGGNHRIVMPYTGNSWDYKDGAGLGHEDLQSMGIDLRLGDTGDDNGGIAGLVDYWKQYRDGTGEDYYFFDNWPGLQEIPDAEKLYNKLASVACVTDENADEYLSYIIDGTNVFWISGASSQEAADHGVTDHILVVVRDWEAYGTSRHDWSKAPEWEWTGSDEAGYTAAMATFKCANHEGHVGRSAAVIRCTEGDEDITYTATAYFNGKKYKDTRTVPLAEEEEEPLPVPGPASGAAAPAAPAGLSVNTASVDANAIRQAIQAAGGSADTLVLGSEVKKIGKGALKDTGITTLIVKSKKLKKKSVKGSLRGSAVNTVKVEIGSRKVNKKYIKKYKKYFTKKNAGKRVKVK